MAYEPGSSDRRAELVDVIRRVRNRWRLKLALRGAVIVVAGTLLALLLSASSLEALRFSPTAIISFRIIALAVFAALVVHRLRAAAATTRHRRSGGAVPRGEGSVARRRPSSARSNRSPRADDTGRGPPPHLVDKLVDQAIEKCRALEDGLVVERAEPAAPVGDPWRHRGGGHAAHHVRSGVPPTAACRRCSSSRAAPRRPAPTRSRCTPGNTKVPRGADQTVTAKLLGFSSADATLMMRTDPAGQFERVPLVAANEPGAFEGMLFHVEKTADYYVESNGVRVHARSRWMSSTCRRWTSWSLEYRFPAYTGLEPRTVEPGGDIAAIKGTDVAPEDHADDGDAGRARAAERERTRCR